MITLSENALQVLKARYLRRDAEGSITESPEQLFQRVASAVAQGERDFRNAEVRFWTDQFFALLSSLDFLPNSPTLLNAPGGQLSGCFVLPVEDSLEGIFEAVKQMALVQATGGGTGFSFSQLRPRGARVASTGGEASGPVSFLHIFNSATEHIKQGGKRRGANMGVLRVDHPDILQFIDAKLDGVSLRNFNLSVGVTDAFMNAAREDHDYDLINPQSGRPCRRTRAREVFEAIVNAAWLTGDPGLLFLDAINKGNPTPSFGAFEATNPCGEIPLLPYESCNLGSLNLTHFVEDTGAGASLNLERLRHTTRLAVRFLDDVLEVNHYPLPVIERMTRGNRKLGLGVMGFADMLIRLGISYDSEQAVQTADQVMGLINQEARAASEALAQERGVFPNWKDSVYAAQNVRVRNATRTAIAPTGTISIIAGTSCGIEPLFALAYRRSHVLGEQRLFEMNELLRDRLAAQAEGDRIIVEVRRTGRLPAMASHLQRLFVTALEIPPERHLQIQAAFQRHVDNSVAKTINVAADVPAAVIADAYWRAWQMGLKGVTIFRYGSKGGQVLELGVDEAAQSLEHGAKCDPEECRL